MTQFDFRYAVSTKSEYDYDCERYGCESICRCGRLKNLRVSNIYVTGMVSEIYNTFKKKIPKNKKNIWTYCLERICSGYTANDFEISTYRGYYGEETDSIWLNDESLIDQFLRLKTPREQIEFALVQEYGYVLEELKNRTWLIEKIDLNKIIIPMQDRYHKLNKEVIRQYSLESDNGFLSCLTDENLKLIDGYHRYYASINNKKKKIWVVRPKRNKK